MTGENEVGFFFGTFCLTSYFWLLWAFFALHGFPGVATSRGYSGYGAWASCWGTSLAIGAWALDGWASAIVPHTLHCPAAWEIFLDERWKPPPLHWQADCQPLDLQPLAHWQADCQPLEKPKKGVLEWEVSHSKLSIEKLFNFALTITSHWLIDGQTI